MGEYASYYADHGGRYRLSELNPYDDYSIHAENDGVTSKSRTVSLSGQEMQGQLNLKISSIRTSPIDATTSNGLVLASR